MTRPGDVAPRQLNRVVSSWGYVRPSGPRALFEYFSGMSLGNAFLRVFHRRNSLHLWATTLLPPCCCKARVQRTIPIDEFEELGGEQCLWPVPPTLRGQGPLLSTLFFRDVRMYQSFRSPDSHFSENKSAYFSLRSFVFGGVRKLHTATQHFGELLCENAVALANIWESSGTCQSRPSRRSPQNNCR